MVTIIMNIIDNKKKKIMRRIYLIWFFRKVFNTTTLKLGALLLLGWQFTAHVSLANVITNWPLKADLVANYKFLGSALVNTEFVTPILMLGISILTVLLAKDLIARQGSVGTRFVRI